MFAHYVTSNALITAQRARVYRKRAGGVVDDEKLSDIMQTLRTWGVNERLVEKLEREVRSLRTESQEPMPEKREVDGDWIEEDDAYAMLEEKWGERPFWRKLRCLMHERGALRRSGQYGKVCFGGAAVRSLADDYIPAHMLRVNPMVDGVSLRAALHGEGIVNVGRLALVPKDVAWRLLNPQPSRAGNPSVGSSVQTSHVERSKHPRNRRVGGHVDAA